MAVFLGCFFFFYQKK